MAKSNPPRATSSAASTRKKSMPPAVGTAPPEPAQKTQPSQDVAPTHEQIAERAYGLWLSRGGHDGDEFSDWLRAESELRRQN